MASSHVVNREWLSQPVDNTRRSIRESMVVGQLFIAVQWWYFCLVSLFGILFLSGIKLQMKTLKHQLCHYSSAASKVPNSDNEESNLVSFKTTETGRLNR